MKDLHYAKVGDSQEKTIFLSDAILIHKNSVVEQVTKLVCPSEGSLSA